jgi:hypothetical protein
MKLLCGVGTMLAMSSHLTAARIVIVPDRVAPAGGTPGVRRMRFAKLNANRPRGTGAARFGHLRQLHD